MHTIEQIINNQKTYKEEILKYFREEILDARKQLRDINSKDEYIMSQKKKLANRFKSTKFANEIGKLFFSSRNRSHEYYVWWDVYLEEAIILPYEQK